MDERQFLSQYFLKSNETLETETEIRPHIFEAYVTKKTARTYRKIALLKFGKLCEKAPDPQLLNLRFTLYNKKQLQLPLQMIERWIEEGWITEEIQFSNDGNTVKASFFRIGISLWYHLEHKRQQQNTKFTTEFQQLIEDFTQYDKTISAKLTTIKTENDLKQSELFPSVWPVSKRLLFLHFTVAFFTLSMKNKLFDYKEIGAAYYDIIGGSKMFDGHKQDFLTHLEQLFNIDATAYGLVSLGQITPLYFCGPLTGTYSRYDYGALHALTDQNIVHDQFTTNARHVWLVENRAILTRMSMETNFLQQTNSFVLCVDGQLRSPHKALILQLVNSSTDVYIWNDYDQAGLTISRTIDDLLPDHRKHFIGRDGHVFTQFGPYQKWLDSTLLQGAHEQEQQLGDVETWTKWMNS